MKKLLLLIFALALFVAVTPQIAWCDDEAATTEPSAQKLFYENKVVPESSTGIIKKVKSVTLNKESILDPKIASEVRERSLEENVDFLLHKATELNFLTEAVSQFAEEHALQLRGACSRDFRNELERAAKTFTAACGGMIDESLMEGRAFPGLRDQTNQLQDKVELVEGYIDAKRLAEQGVQAFDVIVKTGGYPGNVSQEFVVCLPDGTPMDKARFAISEGNAGGQQNNRHLKVLVLGRGLPNSFYIFGNKAVSGPITAEGIIVTLYPLEPDITKASIHGKVVYHLGQDGNYLKRPEVQDMVASVTH